MPPHFLRLCSHQWKCELYTCIHLILEYPPGQISSFAGLEWLKISFLSQIFNTNQNLSGFCQILSFAGLLRGEKCQFWAKFSTWIKISGFCQVSSFEDPECSIMLILSQIFKAENFSKFHPSHGSNIFPRSQVV